MRIILCEGKTDAVLLSYYLGKTGGWRYNRDNKNKKLRIDFSDKSNKVITHFIKDNDDELAICAVGGKDNFADFYSEYIERYFIASEDGETEHKIAIVTDRDDRSVEDIEKYFSKNVISNIANNEWADNYLTNGFGQKIKISALMVVIPHNQQGALENLLLNALSEDEYRGNLIDKSKEFVENISPEAKKIITSDRLKLKTKLGVSLAVLYPEKVFSLIDEHLKEIDWEKTSTINECFKKLTEI